MVTFRNNNRRGRLEVMIEVLKELETDLSINQIFIQMATFKENL